MKQRLEIAVKIGDEDVVRVVADITKQPVIFQDKRDSDKYETKVTDYVHSGHIPTITMTLSDLYMCINNAITFKLGEMR